MTIFINLKFEPSLEYLMTKIMFENVILKNNSMSRDTNISTPKFF